MTGAADRVGIVGLGNMGLPMARRLIAAGHEVVGYDVSPEVRSAFERGGGVAASEVGVVATVADTVLLMLPNSGIVNRVMSDLGIRAALRPGLTVIDMGSSEPLATRALAEMVSERGVAFIDAPVSGGVRGAQSGTLTIMVGGESRDVEAKQQLLENLGRVVHAGPVGAGHAIKALNNLLSATHLWATSEAMLAGERFGLDPRVMLDVLNGSSGRSGSTENKWPNFILTGSYDSGFGLRLMLKDMRIATALAAEIGLPSVLGEQVTEHWAAAAEGLPEDADHTEIARWIARAGELVSGASEEKAGER